MKYKNIITLRKIYKEGGNIIDFLKKKSKNKSNTSEMIELAYDLQAGSYIKQVEKDICKKKVFIDEISKIISQYTCDGQTLLDVGTGELTVLSLMLKKIRTKFKKIYAFDISWSRLYLGIKYANKLLGKKSNKIAVFVADLKQIPIKSKSIDVIVSNHALEPNGGDLKIILRELFRICKKKLILIEPAYELNTAKGKLRMKKSGYIRGLKRNIEMQGGKVIKIIPIINTRNSLNKTACYVIKPPSRIGLNLKKQTSKTFYTEPGSDLILKKKNNYWYSKCTGTAYVELEGIPILRQEYGILATAIMK